MCSCMKGILYTYVQRLHENWFNVMWMLNAFLKKQNVYYFFFLCFSYDVGYDVRYTSILFYSILFNSILQIFVVVIVLYLFYCVIFTLLPKHILDTLAQGYIDTLSPLALCRFLPFFLFCFFSSLISIFRFTIILLFCWIVFCFLRLVRVLFTSTVLVDKTTTLMMFSSLNGCCSFSFFTFDKKPVLHEYQKAQVQSRNRIKKKKNWRFLIRLNFGLCLSLNLSSSLENLMHYSLTSRVSSKNKCKI